MDNVRIPKEFGGPYPGGYRDNHGPQSTAKKCLFALTVSTTNLGTMEEALDSTIEYLNQRAFDFKPIISLGIIQDRPIDMKIKVVETSQSFLITAINMVEQNHKDAIPYAVENVTSFAARRVVRIVSRPHRGECYTCPKQSVDDLPRQENP